MPSVACRRRSNIGRIACARRVARPTSGLEHVKNTLRRQSLPLVLRSSDRIRSVRSGLRRWISVGVVAPAKGRPRGQVQGVDDQRTARDRQSAGNRALAESIEDRRSLLPARPASVIHRVSWPNAPDSPQVVPSIRNRQFRRGPGPTDNTGEEQVDSLSGEQPCRARRTAVRLANLDDAVPISKIPSEQEFFAGLTGNSRSQNPSTLIAGFSFENMARSALFQEQDENIPLPHSGVPQRGVASTCSVTALRIVAVGALVAASYGSAPLRRISGIAAYAAPRPS